jgi:hypothetical protein
MVPKIRYSHLKTCLLAVGIICIPLEASASKTGAEICAERKRDTERDMRLGISPTFPPASKVISPIRPRAEYQKIGQDILFRDLSGYYCDSVNLHPLIYVVDDCFTVVGSNFEKHFRLNELENAIDAYRDLLKYNGILAK